MLQRVSLPLPNLTNTGEQIQKNKCKKRRIEVEHCVTATHFRVGVGSFS